MQRRWTPVFAAVMIAVVLVGGARLHNGVPGVAAQQGRGVPSSPHEVAAYAGRATSTLFEPAAVLLPNTGDSATVAVRVTDLPIGVDVFNFSFVVPSFVHIDNVECGDLPSRTESASPFGPIFVPYVFGSGVTNVACVIYDPNAALPAGSSGEVIRFRVTRIGPGSGTMPFVIDDRMAYGFSTLYEKHGVFVHPGVTNSLIIGSCPARAC